MDSTYTSYSETLVILSSVQPILLNSKRNRIIRPKPKPNIRLPLKEAEVLFEIFGSGLAETGFTNQNSAATEFLPNLTEEGNICKDKFNAYKIEFQSKFIYEI